jgi:hypothetical protein
MKDIDANPDKYDEDTQTALLGITSFAGFNPYGKQIGTSDEIGSDVVNISPIDAYYKNTTQGQITAHHGLKFENVVQPADPDCQCEDPSNTETYSPHKDAQGNCTCTPPDDVKKCPCQKSDGTLIEMAANADNSCPPCTEDRDLPVPGQPAEWWLQDTIKTLGAASDLARVKKYMPNPFQVNLGTPRPTFLDPTRELGANAEQANIQTQGMAQFAGPQALSSRSAGIQGQASKNAADILSKYNNANVNIANQFEMKANDIVNQNSMLYQAANSKLYDQNTIANQQFDNSKFALRGQLRNYYNQGITNKWKTDALNQMYENYKVRPSIGGEMAYKPTAKTVTGQGASSGLSSWQIAYNACKENNPGMSETLLKDCANNGAKSTKGLNNDVMSNAINTMYGTQTPLGKKGGAINENNGYVHINSWLPYIL